MLIIVVCNYIYYNMLASVLKNFGSLTTMRILSRLLVFGLKTYLIRTQLDQQILAYLLNLDLLLTTSLHVARSCFKLSYQKAQHKQHVVKSSMNIMTLGILATIVSAMAVSLMQIYQFQHSQINIINFIDAIALYALSSVCESVAEKYMVECVLNYQYFKIGLIEVASNIPRTVFIFSAAYFGFFGKYGISIFGIGQLLYSASLMLFFYFISNNKSILLQEFKVDGRPLMFDPRSKAALKQFSLLSLLKFILERFEQIALVFMNVAHLSSVYSLINNLGSVITRYLFSPLNQIVFNHFSRGEKEESIKALTSFVKALIIFSVLVGNFGYNYSETFLTFLYGGKWVTGEAIAAMRTYMILVIFLGLNGVIQAFFFAIGKNSINKYNFMSIFTTTFYLGSTMLFLKLGYGTAGLYFGNIINMSSRIILCWYLQIRFHISFEKLIKEVKPSLLFAATSLMIFWISHKQYGYTLNISDSSLLTLVFGGILFGFNLLPILFESREVLIKTFKTKILKQKSQ